MIKIYQAGVVLRTLLREFKPEKVYLFVAKLSRGGMIARI